MSRVHQLIDIEVDASLFPGLTDGSSECGSVFEAGVVVGIVHRINPAAGKHPVPAMEDELGVSTQQQDFEIGLVGGLSDDNHCSGRNRFKICHGSTLESIAALVSRKGSLSVKRDIIAMTPSFFSCVLHAAPDTRCSQWLIGIEFWPLLSEPMMRLFNLSGGRI